MKFFLFLLAVAVGILIMKYTEPIVRTVGINDLAEKYLGAGGTYTMWRLLAILLIVAALVHWVGWRL